ncbi:MAG: hypothetical protein JWN73_3301 [Betaproteobacteria bacterium]|nr:hypothetical protein [Betaproteobacteria bacterium]
MPKEVPDSSQARIRDFSFHVDKSKKMSDPGLRRLLSVWGLCVAACVLAAACAHGPSSRTDAALQVMPTRTPLDICVKTEKQGDAAVVEAMSPKDDGQFKVHDLGVRTADVLYEHWDAIPQGRCKVRDLYHVDAGLGGNIKLMVVRQIIFVIRQKRSGDMKWESYRLGKIVVLSVRPEDTAQLEAFLMKELFFAP